MNLYQMGINLSHAPTDTALEVIRAIVDHLPGVIVCDDMRAEPEGRTWAIEIPVMVTDWELIPSLGNSLTYDHPVVCDDCLMGYIGRAIRESLAPGVASGGYIKTIPINFDNELKELTNGH